MCVCMQVEVWYECVKWEWDVGLSRAHVWGQMQDWEGDEGSPQGLAWLVGRAERAGRQVGQGLGPRWGSSEPCACLVAVCRGPRKASLAWGLPLSPQQHSSPRHPKRLHPPRLSPIKSPIGPHCSSVPFTQAPEPSHTYLCLSPWPSKSPLGSPNPFWAHISPAPSPRHSGFSWASSKAPDPFIPTLYLSLPPSPPPPLAYPLPSLFPDPHPP